MADFWFLKSDEVKQLSFGARSTYYASMVFSRREQYARWMDGDLKLFDVIPSSTYYRHRAEIFEKTGLDLNDFFPGSKPVRVSRY